MKQSAVFLSILSILFFNRIDVSRAVQMSGKKIRLNLQFSSQTSTQSSTFTQESNNGSPAEEKDLEVKKELYSLNLGYNNSDNSPLAIALTPKTLDFGSLNPTSAVTRLQTIAIQKGPAPAYTLYISEDHPPQDASGSGKFVPNTTGDKDKVTISKSGYWLNPLTYGFGYRARSRGEILPDFEKEDTYKQLPSLENGLPREPIIKNSQKDSELTVILKININNNQTDTNYYNTVYYTLIPSL